MAGTVEFELDGQAAAARAALGERAAAPARDAARRRRSSVSSCSSARRCVRSRTARSASASSGRACRPRPAGGRAAGPPAAPAAAACEGRRAVWLSRRRSRRSRRRRVGGSAPPNPRPAEGGGVRRPGPSRSSWIASAFDDLRVVELAGEVPVARDAAFFVDEQHQRLAGCRAFARHDEQVGRLHPAAAARPAPAPPPA